MREIALHFQKVKSFKGTTIIRMNECSEYWYILLEGEIIFNVITDHHIENERYKKQARHLFQAIPKHSSFNFINAYLKHFSLFEIVCKTN